MMLPTHLLAGFVLALPVAWAAPEFATAAYAGGTVGSIVPDLDVFASHRRTLHYPVYYPIAAVPAGLAALLVPHPATVAATLILLAAALHCRMDELGGSLEFRPWTERSDRGVYDHHAGEWRPPRRWIRYDGSPGDLAMSGLLAIPLLLAPDRPVQWLVIAALLVAIAYATLRRRVADAMDWLEERAPNDVRSVLPRNWER